MGTNFYWRKNGQSVDDHIGKRSAAGYYCFDCNITLCKAGDGGVHHSKSGWYDKCPKCGKEPLKEGLNEGAAAVELGFSKLATKKKKGVASCSSFTWGIPKESLYKSRRKYVFDEYDRKMLRTDFIKMIRCNCPIQYYDQIGKEFS